MRPTTNFRTVFHVTALVSCLVATPAFSQTVRGKVVNRSTGVGVVGASMLLVNEAGQVQKMAITDVNGEYSIVAPEPGTYTFRVDAPGYNRHDEPPFAVLPGRILELEIRLWDLTELEPVVVTAESTRFAPGPLEGFHERMEQGRGYFVTREQIEMRGAHRFTDILRGAPGINVIPLAGSSYYTIRIKGVLRATRDCPPVLYVDNVKWGAIDIGDGPDRELFPHEIEAIEVYRPSAVPIDFSTIDADCGAVVVWTKRAP